jgi:hypothetical protein
MRSALIVSAFAALTLAAPRPQEIDFDTVDAAPDAPIYEAPAVPVKENVPSQSDATAVKLAIGSITETVNPEKRDLLNVIDNLSGRAEQDCSALPAGTGPTVNTPDDTAESFLAYQPFRTNSTNAVKPENVPAGYSVAFSNLDSVTSTSSHLGTDL